MSKRARTIPVAVLVATALAASASPAGAAVTIGQLDPAPGTSFICGLAGADWAQPTVTSGNPYVVPGIGTITSWSHNAGPGDGRMLGMKIFRKVADPGTYLVVGHAGPHALAAGTLNVFPARIPVQPGDVLGVNQPNGTQSWCLTMVSGDSTLLRSGSLADGEQGTFSPFANHRLNVSAVVEPDCDGDGLGDETQDTNISTCAAPGPGSTSVFCKGKPATIVGTAGSDVRTGSRGRDVIVGLGGSDRLSGLAGNDLICGGKGKDNLSGGKGKDKLYGQKGRDRLRGKAGKDLCVGGPGKDKAKACEKTKSI
jgi:hypothetical protein